MPSRAQVASTNSKKARIASGDVFLTLSASIARPMIDLMRGLRFMKPDTHCLPSGFSSRFIRSIREAISRTLSCPGGNPRVSSSSIHVARNCSCSGVNLCWWWWATRQVAAPRRRSSNVVRGRPQALEAALIDLNLPSLYSAMQDCIIRSRWSMVAVVCVVD